MSHRKLSGIASCCYNANTKHIISPITAVTFDLGTSDVYCLTARNLAGSIHLSLIQRLISMLKKNMVDAMTKQNK